MKIQTVERLQVKKKLYVAKSFIVKVVIEVDSFNKTFQFVIGLLRPFYILKNNYSPGD